ncbi:MAG: DUF1425 domain-containing protein [Phycisphaeraceae bacterium]
MKRFAQWTVLLAFALATVACQTKPPQGARDDRYGGERYPRVVGVGDIGDDLSVDAPQVKPGPNPPMQVSVPVRLRRNDPQPVQYRFLFLDAAGAPTQDDFGWAYLTMQPRTQTFFTGRAMSPDATDWRLEIREASKDVEYE